jgi:peroxiredoxin
VDSYWPPTITLGFGLGLVSSEKSVLSNVEGKPPTRDFHRFSDTVSPSQALLRIERQAVSLLSLPHFLKFKVNPMALLETPVCDFGRKAPDFSLLGIDGKIWTLEECKGENALLVMFICNHCPYVKAVQERIVRDARDLLAFGINTVAIQPNDPTDYPEDSFENMKAVAERFGFSFPYLFDETQEVAKAYGAVCTPDFFGYNRGLELQYRGRIDASRREAAPEGTHRDLYEAMKLVAETGKGPAEQFIRVGCSIKWRG